MAVANYVADERLDDHGQVLQSQFRSTDTWLKTKDGWKVIAMQVLAVLHDPPPSPSRARRSAGTTGRITTKIACTEDGLSCERTGRPAAAFQAEVRDVFFQPGQPRTRRIFLRDGNGAITGFADRREGQDIRWTKVE